MMAATTSRQKQQPSTAALPATVQMYVDAARLNRAQVKVLLELVDWAPRAKLAVLASYPVSSEQRPRVAQVAEQYGVSMQYVYTLRKRVEKLYLTHGAGDANVPIGWLREVITLPPSLMLVVKGMEKQAFEALGHSTDAH